MKVTHSQPKTPGDPQRFTGRVWLQEIGNSDGEAPHLHMLKVGFEPGARTFWHSHPAGQILYV